MMMKCLKDPHLNFTYGVVTAILSALHLVHDVSLYKMMVPNLLRLTENDNLYFYKMSFRFYHQVT